MSASTDYRKFGTPRQIEIHEAIETHGGERAAARALGVVRSTVRDSECALKKKMALGGAVPTANVGDTVPAPFVLKGESQLTNLRTGEAVMVWRKTNLDQQQRWQMIVDGLQNLTKELPRLATTAAPRSFKKDLLNLVTISDLHMGMRAWKEVSGENWDLKIAERVAVGVFCDLIERAPPADVCIIANLGDFFHYDGIMPVTPTSGHILDADSRYPKMFEYGIKVFRRIVDKALETHREVHLLFEEGNHDLVTTPVAMKAVFKALYENHKRVKFIDGHAPYHVFEFGKVMLAWHHSHLAPMEKLDRIFASMFSEIWGRTKFRYGHTGDKHHLKVIDQFGMTVTQHATIASMDAWAARHGYAAAREATLHTYHRERGKVSSITSTPEMVK